MVQQKQQHFLLVCHYVQSHVNPALQLAHRLTGTGAHVTFSTAISRHRLMFPTNPTFPLDDPKDPLLSYSPYSDGYDDGFDSTRDKGKDFLSSQKLIGYETLRSIASAPATANKPAVTCIIYTILLPWAAKVALGLALPSFLFWLQPVAVFAVYYHYFHEYKTLIDSHNKEPSFEISLPGLPPLNVQDLPSFLVPSLSGSDTDSFNIILRSFEEMYQILDEEIEAGLSGIRKPQLLVNSFESLEHEVLNAASENSKLELIPVGPLLPQTKNSTTAAEGYMEWLDRWPEKSVVYLSFGSISFLGKRQKEEFSRALAESRRPYLWVVRGDREGVEVEEKGEEGTGMVVGWCSQVDVLSHGSVGCFVTHCGWNSTLESIACGVPMVAFPQWSDQPTNASLVEGLWGTGVRLEVNEGVVEERELRRCLDLVMGEEESGVEIRRKAQMLKENATDAAGGSSDRNLKAFVNGIGFSD